MNTIMKNNTFTEGCIVLNPWLYFLAERANGLRYWQVGGRGLCLGRV